MKKKRVSVGGFVLCHCWLLSLCRAQYGLSSLACLVKGSYLCKIIHAHGKMSLNESFNIINFSLVIKKNAHYRKFGRQNILKEKTHIFIQHRNDNILVYFISKIHLYVYVHHIHTPVHYKYNHAIYNAICVS